MRGGGGGADLGGRGVPPVGATVAVDVTSPGAPRRRALEDVFMHGQNCEESIRGGVFISFQGKKTKKATITTTQRECLELKK